MLTCVLNTQVKQFKNNNFALKKQYISNFKEVECTTFKFLNTWFCKYKLAFTKK